MPEETHKPIEMDEAARAFFKSGTVPPKIYIRGRNFFPKVQKGEGYKGVVFRGKDEYDGDVAIKFTVFADYMERSYLEEANRARALCDSEYFARFLDAGITQLTLPNDEERKFVVFIEQWIDGVTLSDYIHENTLTPSFFLNYVRGMCSALGVLAAKGFRHDDLRPENVMIMNPLEGDVNNESTIKVIDTGSMKLLSTPTKKTKDDYRWFAEHLLCIRNLMYRSKPHSLYSARFIQEIDPLLDRMLEEDRGVSLWAPGRVLTEFSSASTRAHAPLAEKRSGLTHPFDYIAAEHIVSDELLVRIFADSCPWFAEVSSPNPVLLTGPRGCGKSMVFRRLSLKALLYKSVDEIVGSQIAGFYVSCSSDLRNRLGWVKTEQAAQRFRNQIIHYFNLLVLREIVQTLAAIAMREDREAVFGFGINEESGLHEYLMTQLHVSEPEQRRLQGMSRMEHALHIVEKKMDECFRAMRMGIRSTHETDAGLLADVTRFMSKTISFFIKRKAVLLIDDFSVHRLPGPVQSILNIVLWDRQGTYVTKISSEKYGAEGIDELKATSEITRELREFDCGRYYLDAKFSATRAFAEDLLTIRLKLAGYSGTPDQLIGPSEYPKGGLGKVLWDKPAHPGRKNTHYHGMKTIADICSGDVSNLLEVYRRIFERGNVDRDTTKRVPHHIQHEAIQSVSRDFFDLIRNFTPFGPEMYRLVQSFGNLSRLILQKGALTKHGKRFDASQTTRIEVEPPARGQPSDELGTAQQQLMDELVRRTIFIEMQPGRSRHQFATTLRWQLRRIYCPTFGTSIYKNTAIKWNPDTFKHFLIDPKTACEAEFKSRWERNNGQTYIDETGDE